MNPRSESDSALRVVGIDPGTENLGFSVLDLSLATGQITVVHSETIVSQRMLSDYRLEERFHGSRTARLMALEDRLFLMLELFQPHAVCAESPFLNKRFPQAFAALTECISYIKRAVFRYDRFKTMTLVDPPTAKKAVGVKVVRGITKDDVANAVAKLPLTYADGISLPELDEHQIDSIAVAYYQALTYKAQIPNP